MTPETYKERDEARARVEIITPHENNPVAEYFSSSNTPETDEQINGKPCTRFAIAAGDSLRDALVPSEFARKLERERDEARKALVRSNHFLEQAEENLDLVYKERDEAREVLREIAAADWKTSGELRGMARKALEVAK